MTDLYDVVVIGGGPAGSAAAYTLAKNHIRVCLIDKSPFPRDKLCGGLVTLRSKNIFESTFGRTWDDTLFVRSDRVRFFSGETLLAESEKDYTTLFFAMRIDFDAYLLGLAAAAGAIVKVDARVSSIDLKDNRIVLESDEQIAFRFLVGADGVNSRVAKELFGSSFDENTIGFGLEVEVPREQLPSQSNIAEIDFAAANWGYGWVFPKTKTFTMGVGGIHKLNIDLKERLSEFLMARGLSISSFKVKGQYIPFGDFRRRPGKGNVLLCGDAAGVVDPITGEGIAYAMQSGAAAGRAITKSLSTNQPDQALSTYMVDFRAVAESITQANRWRCLIFPKIVQRPFAWAFSDAGTLQKGYLDILAGKRDYSDLYGLFLLQARKAVQKAFRFAKSKILRQNPGS